MKQLMAATIKHPYRSPAIVLILNRIHEMDSPYASGIADSLGDQVTDIQTYLDTMHNRGWTLKQRDGRRQVLSINPEAIWKDSKYRRKLTFGGIFDGDGKEAMEERLQRLLNDALLYKIFYAVETTSSKSVANTYEDRSEVWVKGPDTLLDKDELVWYGCDTTLDEILAVIVATLKTIKIMTGEAETEDLDVFISTYDSDFVEQCRDIFHGEATIEDFDDLIEDMVENPVRYV